MIFASARLFCGMVLGASLVLLPAVHAVARERTRDLGSIPASGAQAAQTLHAREQAVISELACGDEAKFMAALRWLPQDRPLDNLMAKAATFSGATSQTDECSIVQAFDADEWKDSFDRESERTKALPTPVPLGPTVTLADGAFGTVTEAINTLNGEIGTPSSLVKFVTC